METFTQQNIFYTGNWGYMYISLVYTVDICTFWYFFTLIVLFIQFLYKMFHILYIYHIFETPWKLCFSRIKIISCHFFLEHVNFHDILVLEKSLKVVVKNVYKPCNRRRGHFRTYIRPKIISVTHFSASTDGNDLKFGMQL